MLLDELRKLTKMTFLMEHLTTQLGLSHDSVKVGWNDPIERTRKGEKRLLVDLNCWPILSTLRYIIVSLTRIEVEVERAGEEDLDFHYVMNVPRLKLSGLANPPTPEPLSRTLNQTSISRSI